VDFERRPEFIPLNPLNSRLYCLKKSSLVQWRTFRDHIYSDGTRLLSRYQVFERTVRPARPLKCEELSGLLTLNLTQFRGYGFFSQTCVRYNSA
jgi:hypothetical protein